MKFTRKKDDISTIRKVWNDEKTVCYGVVGTIGDFLSSGILTQSTYDRDKWLYLPKESPDNGQVGNTREEAVRHIK